MFDFLLMSGNYESRRIGRWDDESGDRMVSTAYVNDGAHPYETAFKHPDYNDGKMVIVEAYDTKELAAVGHAKWQSVMVDGPLPDELIDCVNCKLAQFLDVLSVPCGEENWNRFPRRSAAQS